MRKIYAYFFSIMFFIQLFVGLSSANNLCNPKSCDGDFILPMPGNLEMVFRPVFLNTGENPFAMKEFKVGGYKRAGFKEFVTDVVVGGAFVENHDWLYYIGKYEVTQAQYDAIMGMGAGTQTGGQYPVNDISWFEAQEFAHKYNLWLFTNAQNRLPKNENAYGFIRLPTEIEWEFAARGGAQVNAEQFDKKHPYPPDEISKYEWFVGHTSSYGKLKEIGLLKPNPLQIHDMLGNVSEMTSSFYQIEYYQGRLGGFVFKGGNYTTAEQQLRSSMRGEIPFYKFDDRTNQVKVSKQKTLGIRLVISSPIYASRATSKKLMAEWDNYVNENRSAPVAKPQYKALPISDQADIQIADAFKSLQAIVDEMNKRQNASQTMLDHLGILNASFTNINSTIRKAENDSAYAWVSMSSYIANFIRDWITDLTAKQTALAIAKDRGKSAFTEKIQNHIDYLEKNISDGFSRYGNTFNQLENLRRNAVEKAFDKYIADMNRKGNKTQAVFCALAKRHYQEYLNYRRIDADKWKADFEKLK